MTSRGDGSDPRWSGYSVSVASLSPTNLAAQPGAGSLSLLLPSVELLRLAEVLAQGEMVSVIHSCSLGLLFSQEDIN